MIKLFSLLFLFGSTALFVNPFPVFHSGMTRVKDIPLPAGYKRISVIDNSFAAYLQNLPLRKNKTIYLYNKQPKSNQSLHYAVIDISTGEKDLQQCADAIMRLRAEYFFEKKQFDSIRFLKDGHSYYQYSSYTATDKNSHETLLHFMEQVFINCGTYSLEQQLKPVHHFQDLQIGDVFVKAGAPGHAEIVADMAVNSVTGKKIFLLIEGYMPAQDIHVLLNPSDLSMGPWYELNDEKEIVTASWIFMRNQLRCW